MSESHREAATLRVLHLNLAAGGGVARYGLLYGASLADREDVTCLNVWNRSLASGDGILRPFLPQDGVAVSMAGVRARVSALAAVVGAVRRFRPHVIHDTAGSAMWMGAWLWPWLARRAPLIITEHDPVPHDRMGWRVHERLSRALVRRSASRIIVHGESSVRDLMELGVPRERIHTELHGSFGPLLDLEEAVPRDPHTVLFFGAMRPNKGIAWLPAIADGVRQVVPEARFIVAGAPGLPRSLQRTDWPQELTGLLAEFRRRPEFDLHDRHIPDADIGGYFQRAAVTLLPYRDATQSGVAMLAMPAGSTVLATAVGNLPDTIRDGVTGVLSEPDADAIAERLIGLLSNPANARRIGEVGRKFAATTCSWSAIAARTLTVYQRSIERRRST